MRVQVINGSTSGDLTKETNDWLAANENEMVIISISPAMPRNTSGGGGYITVVYSETKNIFEQVKESRD